MALYESLALQYIDRIQAGKLPSGTRLPALRVLAKQHSVSMTTAKRAYHYLEETGWVFSQPQSGFFVSKQALLTLSPLTPAFKGESRDPQQFAPDDGYNPENDFFCPLGTAMIAPLLKPKVELQRAIKRSTSRLSDAFFACSERQGERAIRYALSDHFQQDHFSILATDLVMTNGCMEAIHLALETTTKVGDTIAISSPCFSGLLDLLAGSARNILEIPTTDQGLDLEQLETYMQTKTIQACLFNTSHMNPSGTSLSVEQKQRLAQLAERYQLPIIEDDVYFELSHHGKLPLPAKHWDKAGYIIWCGSFSKTLSEGLHLGWCAPGRYLEDYVKRQQLVNIGVNHLAQMSVAELINTGEYRSYINKTRIRLNHQVQQYRQLMKQHLPATARISMPDGGLVLWIQVPNLDANRLARKARKLNIDIRTGSRFSTHEYYQNCFRINCGWPLGDELKSKANTQIHTQESTQSVHEKIVCLCRLVEECQ